MGPKKIIAFVILGVLTFGGIVYFNYSKLKFNQNEEDFLYLANILYENTKDLDNGSDKLEAMTDWLHQEVKHASGKYPPHFNGKVVANVIRGGVGNCGYQSCNIACFGELLGYKKFRIIHVKKTTGSKYDHAFCEIMVDGKWKVYDPDLLQYQKNDQGEIMGIADMVRDTMQVENKIFRTIASEMNSKVTYQITGSWQQTPMPFGEDGYEKFSEAGGEFGFKMGMVLDGNWVKFILMSSIVSALLTLVLSKKLNL